MTARHLLTLVGVAALGLSGVAILLPNRLRRWLVNAADRIAEDLVAAIEDAMDVLGDDVA